MGHYKPVNSARYLNQTSEYVFHLTKGGDVPLAKLSIGTPYQDKSNVARWGAAKADVRDLGNVWFIPYETVQRARPHPCVFPVKLPKQCIMLHGLEKTHLVMDPFVGTGTTGRAAADLGVEFSRFRYRSGVRADGTRCCCPGTCGKAEIQNECGAGPVRYFRMTCGFKAPPHFPRNCPPEPHTELPAFTITWSSTPLR